MKRFIIYKVEIKKYFGNINKLLSGSILFQTDDVDSVNDYVNDVIYKDEIHRTYYEYYNSKNTFLKNIRKNHINDYRNGKLNHETIIILKDNMSNDHYFSEWDKLYEDFILYLRKEKFLKIIVK